MISSVYIAKNVYGGDGLGRLGDGRVVFVPGAWTGEQVRAQIVDEKKRFVTARLVEVTEASPDRVNDPGATVPGMVYATLSPAGEEKAKEAQLREFFDRARIPVPSLSFAGHREMSHYRNKVVYHFVRVGKEWKIGYLQEPMHEVLDVVHDPLARPEINASLKEIRENILRLLTTGPESVRRDTARKEKVTIRWTKKTGVKWWLGDAPKDLVLKETTLGRDFEVPADGFYQVNSVVGEDLVREVVAAYEKGKADAPDVLDLYCGVGVFGLCCQATKLTGIESGHQAIRFAKKNAADQGVNTARFFAEQVGRNLRRIPVSARTTVIVDPPRGGLEPGVAKWLAHSAAPRIFYVSCDPATLMRDLKELHRAYAVEDVKWFNMFARTARFETFVSLVRRTGETKERS